MISRMPMWCLAMLAALAVSACGSDGDSTTGETGGTTVAELRPSGVLGTSSIGPVKVGAPEEEVRAAFGEPDRVSDTTLPNGIDQRELIWASPSVRLQFDPQTGNMRSYTAISDDLATADGFMVGTPIAEIKKKYGARLGDFLGQVMLSEEKKNTFPAIIFAEKNGTVFRIDGGRVVSVE